MDEPHSASPETPGAHLPPEAAEDTTPDDGPQPLGIGVRPTGHAPLDAHLQRLADADGIGVAGHPEVYEDVHRALRETLASLDRPAPGM
ncbi:hypothetical protein ACL02R_18090 [Streptomyces sp. MS19]|uniref:hypothetical protein n=1 Tax=Streptomyces sp. MS19 TaxID=3385972 RepID=UPI0039A0BAE5